MCCIVVFNFFLFCLSMDCLCLTQINNNNNNNIYYFTTTIQDCQLIFLVIYKKKCFQIRNSNENNNEMNILMYSI